MPLTMTDLISFHAFTSLWYWVVLALVWSRVSQAPMGVPLDLYDRALRIGPDDAFSVIRVGVARQLALTGAFGPVLIGFWAFGLTTLICLGVWYGLELAQAILLMAVPLALVQALATRTAQRMAAMEPELDPLLHELRRLRFQVQVIALAAIFVSAIWGMFFALSNAIL